MNFKGLFSPPHDAVLMEDFFWRPGLGFEYGYTAMCLETQEVGMAGPSECYVLRHKVTEERMRKLAVHMLDHSCCWSHKLI